LFEELMETLKLNTSSDGVVDYEVGPVADHVNAVFGAVLDLRAMNPLYDINSALREGVGAGWAGRANVVAEATGVAIVASVDTEEKVEQLGADLSLREPEYANEIIERAIQLK